MRQYRNAVKGVILVQVFKVTFTLSDYKRYHIYVWGELISEI